MCIPRQMCCVLLAAPAAALLAVHPTDVPGAVTEQDGPSTLRRIFAMRSMTPPVFNRVERLSSPGDLDGVGIVPGWPRSRIGQSTMDGATVEFNEPETVGILRNMVFKGHVEGPPVTKARARALSDAGVGITAAFVVISLVGMFVRVPQLLQRYGACAIYLVLSMTIDVSINISSAGWSNFNPAVCVVLCESGKLLLTLAMILFVKLFRTTSEGQHLPSRLDVLHFAPASLLFAVNNILLFNFIARVDIGTFALLRETGLCWVVMWWWVVFRVPLGLKRRLAIVGLTALGLVSCTKPGTHLRLKDTWAIASPLASALGSVANEFALKRTHCGINVQNAITYTMCASFAVLYLLIADHSALSPARFASTFPSGGAQIVVMQCMLGLTVSRILKYADAVTRQILTGFRAPLFLLYASAVFHTPPDMLHMILAICMAICATTFVLQGSLSHTAPKLEDSAVKAALVGGGADPAQAKLNKKGSHA